MIAWRRGLSKAERKFAQWVVARADVMERLGPNSLDRSDVVELASVHRWKPIATPSKMLFDEAPNLIQEKPRPSLDFLPMHKPSNALSGGVTAGQTLGRLYRESTSRRL